MNGSLRFVSSNCQIILNSFFVWLKPVSRVKNHNLNSTRLLFTHSLVYTLTLCVLVPSLSLFQSLCSSPMLALLPSDVQTHSPPPLLSVLSVCTCALSGGCDLLIINSVRTATTSNKDIVTFFVHHPGWISLSFNPRAARSLNCNHSVRSSCNLVVFIIHPDRRRLVDKLITG